MRWSAALLAATALACGSKSSPEATAPLAPPDIPERAATGGDDLLALAPTGADAVLEIDLARLRGNPVIGPVFRALAGSPADGTEARVDLFAAGDLIVIISYDIGSDDTERLVLLRGDDVRRVEGATPISDKVVAIASDAMLARLRAVAAGKESSLMVASQLIRLRALAMPERADGAALRIAAHLDWNAQIALAKALDLDEVPVSISLWGDVADDLAIIALVGGKTKTEGGALAGSLTNIRDKLIALPVVRGLGLGAILRRARVENQGSAARLVLLVGPRRLERVAERLLTRLGVSAPAATGPGEPAEASP